MAKIPFNVDAYTAKLIGRENVSKLEGAILELVNKFCCISIYIERYLSHITSSYF